MKHTPFLPSALLFFLLASSPGNAQLVRPAATPAATGTAPETSRGATPPAASQRGKLQSFAFEGAPLEVVMAEYCRWTGKIYLKNDKVNASITFNAGDRKLTTEESIEIVEALLALNDIMLIPDGPDRVKVVPATVGPTHSSGIIFSDTPPGASDLFITQVIPLKNVEIQEVQAAVQHVLHTYGKILALPGSNSLMISDTEEGIRRAMEVISFIDKAASPIETRYYTMQYAEATEIASKLTEIVTAAQGDQRSSAASRASTRTSTRTTSRTSTIRAGTRTTATPTRATISQAGESSQAKIQGSVKIVADERTRLIIIFSQKENFPFFDELIQKLDVEITPTIGFEVINLEYSDATEMSGTLNDLVSSAAGTRASTSSRTSTRSSSSTRSTSPTSRYTSSARLSANASGSGNALGNLARLSEDTKILAHERTNAIILMGEKNDIAMLKQVIAQLDIMLDQVIIEAAIFEVGLDDSLRHGLDLLYRASGDERIGAWDGTTLITNAIENVASGAFTYYQNLAGINSKVLINLAASDSDARLISTPNITTTDNTEATIRVGESRPIVTGTTSYANSSGSSSSTYSYKDIGIELIVTPQITPNDIVVMEIAAKADQVGGSVDIDDNSVPITLNREFNAVLTVPSGDSVVLGGLISNDVTDEVTKIPLLGDIPLIGRYLFSSVSKSEVQRELIMVITPTVMDDLTDIQQQTQRLYQGTSLRQEDWSNNWSASPLRDLPDPEDEGADAPTSQKMETQDLLELMGEMDAAN